MRPRMEHVKSIAGFDKVPKKLRSMVVSDRRQCTIMPNA